MFITLATVGHSRTIVNYDRTDWNICYWRHISYSIKTPYSIVPSPGFTFLLLVDAVANPKAKRKRERERLVVYENKSSA